MDFGIIVKRDLWKGTLACKFGDWNVNQAYLDNTGPDRLPSRSPSQSR